eukprot:COSAG02_NODE_1782_length_10945_cov_9.882722_4_plen_935_part_00
MRSLPTAARRCVFGAFASATAMAEQPADADAAPRHLHVPTVHSQPVELAETQWNQRQGGDARPDPSKRYLHVPERQLKLGVDDVDGDENPRPKANLRVAPKLTVNVPAPRTVWGTAEQDVVAAKQSMKNSYDAVKTVPSGCARGRACALRLCARKVRGFELPVFFSLLGSLVLPSMDAASDWAVTLSWYDSGDYGWFTSGLIIQLLSGTISGVMLTWMLREGEHDIGGKSITRTTRGGRMHTGAAMPVGMVLGMLGLGPAAMGALVLWSRDPNALNFLKVFKVLELVFEALPQLVLQTYVGTAFGLLDPSSDEFDVLLACSVGVALLGSGVSCLSFEAIGRYAFESGEEMVTVASSYGVFTVLMRSAQTASLVLSIALLGCAFKGGAAVAAVLAVLLYVGLGFEAMTRDEDRESKRCCSGIQACGGKYSFICGIAGEKSRRGAIMWAALHALLVGGSAAAFFRIDHLSNNYNDYSLPVTSVTSAPQYYDCHDRTSGLYPAALASVLSVVLLPLSLLVDPKYGARRCRFRTWEARHRDAEQAVVDEWIESKRGIPLEKKISHIWRWASMGMAGVDTAGQHLDGQAITRLARAVGAHHCVWSRDEGRRHFITKGHSVRGIHNGGEIGIAETRPNAFGIAKILWDNSFRSDQCHISKLELLDLHGTHALMTRHLSGRSLQAAKPIRGAELGLDAMGGISMAQFTQACKNHPDRTEEWYCAVLSSAHLLEVRITAIWNWSAVVGNDFLGPEELTRLALKVNGASSWEVMRLQLALEDTEAILRQLRDASAVELAHLERSPTPDGDLMENIQLKMALLKKLTDQETIRLEQALIKATEVDRSPVHEQIAATLDLHEVQGGSGDACETHDARTQRMAEECTLAVKKAVAKCSLGRERVTRKEFFAICRMHSHRTKRWFSALQLSLVKKKQSGMLDVLCDC